MTNPKYRLIKDGKIIGYEFWDTFSQQWMYSTDNLNWYFKYIPHDHKDAYTGLRDKNGVEIYEGDIVESDKMHPCSIQFHEGSFTFNDDDPFTEHFAVYSNDNIEVIGNKWTHPELLKEES